MEVGQVIILEDIDKTITLPQVEDYDKICRLCLISLTDNALASKSVQDVQDRIKISSLLQVYTAIKVPEFNDNLPPNICTNCIKSLVNMQIFRSRCLVNEDLLQKLLAQTAGNNTNMGLIKTEHDFDTENTEPDVITSYKIRKIIHKINEERMGNHELPCEEVVSSSVQTENPGKSIYRREHFPCKYCEKIFWSTSALISHLRSHTLEKPFICKVCNVGYTKKQSLERHFMKHSGEKPYSCDKCGKKFTRLYNLRAHEENHTGKMIREQRSHLCDVCGEKFTHSNELIVHKREHDKKASFSCGFCNKKFTFFKGKRKHEMKKHGVCETFQDEQDMNDDEILKKGQVLKVKRSLHKLIKR